MWCRCTHAICFVVCASMLLRCTQTWMPTVTGEALRLYTFKVHDICVNLIGSELDKETAWPLSRAREREREINIYIYRKVHRWKYTWLTIPSLQDPLTAPGALLIFLSSPLDCLSADVPLWGSLYKTRPPILALKRTHKAPSSTRRLVFVRLEKRGTLKKRTLLEAPNLSWDFLGTLCSCTPTYVYNCFGSIVP